MTIQQIALVECKHVTTNKSPIIFAVSMKYATEQYRIITKTDCLLEIGVHTRTGFLLWMFDEY